MNVVVNKPKNKLDELAPKIITSVFLSVPFVFSIISMVHVFAFLKLGNSDWVSVVIASTYELANLSILLAVVVMVNLRQTVIWICFFVLLAIQLLGNVYYSFEFAYTALEANAEWLNHYVKFFDLIDDSVSLDGKILILACILGIPIPSVSLMLTKAGADYWRSKAGSIVEENRENGEASEEYKGEISTQGENNVKPAEAINKVSDHGLKIVVKKD